MSRSVETFDTNIMLGIMQTYRAAFPKGIIVAPLRGRGYHLIWLTENGQERCSFTSYQTLVRFMDRRAEKRGTDDRGPMTDV